jgi:hypothetical protein
LAKSQSSSATKRPRPSREGGGGCGWGWRTGDGQAQSGYDKDEAGQDVRGYEVELQPSFRASNVADHSRSSLARVTVVGQERLLIVIPAYNETSRIGPVVRDVRAELPSADVL